MWDWRALSKRLTAPYKSGPFAELDQDPDSPAMVQAREHFARLRE